jgi:hypothetical protein
MLLMEKWKKDLVASKDAPSLTCLALYHKYTTCGKYVHNPCAIQNSLFDEGDSTQSQPGQRYCRLTCKPST